MGGSKPTATGTLGDTPFCEVLVYGLANGLTGSLVLECPNRTKHAIRLQAGNPVKGRVDDPSIRIGTVLQSLGAIDAGAREAAERGAPNMLFGQRLLQLEAVDEKALTKGLAEQLGRQLAWLSCAPPGTGFAYYEGVDLLSGWAPHDVPIDPLAGIWRAIEASAPGSRVVDVCRGFANTTLRLHPASRVGRFGFGARERAVVDVLRLKPQTLSELEATGLVERYTLHKVLYALALTRHLDTGQQPLGVDAQSVAFVGPASVRRPTPPPGTRVSSARYRAVTPPPGSSRSYAVKPSAEAPSPAPEPLAQAPVAAAAAPETRERPLAQTGRFLSRAEIEAKVAVLDTLSHYELLEIPEDASQEQVALAFPGLARRWHPDRLSPDLADLKEAVTRTFARMTEASRVLSHGASRQEYDRARRPGAEVDSEQAQVERVLRAAEAFQKAEIVLKKRDLDAALGFAKAAHLGDPAQPEYAALYAWVRARRPNLPEPELTECLELLQTAVAKQKDNVKIRYYLATVLKLAGKHKEAIREFRFVADRDPSNLEAARELRLHDMRRQAAKASEPPPDSNNFFSRLFKR